MSSFIFFFQAEDGIRDRDVTGVQTCALPISQRPAAARAGQPSGGRGSRSAARDPSQAARLGSDLAARVESRPLMIKRLIRRVLGLPSEVRVPRGQHDLTRDAISPATAKVCAALRDAGFSGYVVGGAVRDLLLGITPKDFDVATDARPEQVRPLFRRAIIIGRRFRLVHVMLGPETIEVSTFRAADPETAEKDEHGRVLRDNVFGTQEEDARRRDFSVN